MKWYLNNVCGYDEDLEEFDSLSKCVFEDENGNQYFTNEYDFLRWEEVAEAMAFINRNDFGFDWYEIDTYDPFSYVRLAESYGFNDYGKNSLRNRLRAEM